MKERVRPGLPHAGARGDGSWTLAMGFNWPNTPASGSAHVGMLDEPDRWREALRADQRGDALSARVARGSPFRLAARHSRHMTRAPALTPQGT